MNFKQRKAKEPKYHNHSITNAFGKFDSELEFHRYLFLLERAKIGDLRHLRRQVKYILIPTQKEAKIVQLKTKTKVVESIVEKECSYYADFVYERKINGEWVEVVEDIKGSLYMVTDVAKLKKKMMYYFHKIKVQYVTKSTEW